MKNNIFAKFLIIILLMACFCLPNFLNFYWGDFFSFILALVLTLINRITIPHYIASFIFFYLILLTSIAIGLLIIDYQNGSSSIYYLLRASRFLFWFVILFIISKYLLASYSKFILGKLIPVIFILHALFIYIVYFDILNLRESVMTISGASNIIIVQDFRSSGMWGGFDSASTFMAIGILYFITLYTGNHFFKYIAISICSIALILTAARIGLALICLYIIYTIIKNILNLKIKVLLKYLFIFPFTIVSLCLSLVILNENQLLPERFNSTANRMLEVINNKGSTTSTDSLMTMFYLPKSESTLLIGNSLDSFYNNDAVKSDVEYVKFIWGIGVPLSLILFTYALLGLFFLSRTYHTDEQIYKFFNILLLIVVISSVKGEYIFAYRISTFYILIFWLSIYNTSSNKL